MRRRQRRTVNGHASEHVRRRLANLYRRQLALLDCLLRCYCYRSRCWSCCWYWPRRRLDRVKDPVLVFLGRREVTSAVSGEYVFPPSQSVDNDLQCFFVVTKSIRVILRLVLPHSFHLDEVSEMLYPACSLNEAMLE